MKDNAAPRRRPSDQIHLELKSSAPLSSPEPFEEPVKAASAHPRASSSVGIPRCFAIRNAGSRVNPPFALPPLSEVWARDRPRRSSAWPWAASARCRPAPASGWSGNPDASSPAASAPCPACRPPCRDTRRSWNDSRRTPPWAELSWALLTFLQVQEVYRSIRCWRTRDRWSRLETLRRRLKNRNTSWWRRTSNTQRWGDAWTHPPDQCHACVPGKERCRPLSPWLESSVRSGRRTPR